MASTNSPSGAPGKDGFSGAGSGEDTLCPRESTRLTERRVGALLGRLPSSQVQAQGTGNASEAEKVKCEEQPHELSHDEKNDHSLFTEQLGTDYNTLVLELNLR